ncbi:hypothetical protein [Hyalangium sp.]|uniref:hypothetical protein n=1 Tax=Hyalangium sp. TaxID=2028555 RepID=UPI002D25BAA1|nr:hypothetical protein [Hyalangium sp.]HYH97025.1 hypothetical protein [Hyalangium sp.]
MQALSEQLSPFVPWSSEDRTPLAEAEASTTPSGSQPLLVDLLRDPAAVTERLLDPQRLQGLVLGSVGIIAGCTSFFAAAATVARGKEAWWGSAVLASLNVLMSLAASLGPIYATGILLAARVPLARLVAALLAAAATGSLLLAGLASPLYMLTRLNAEWGGPLMLTSSFLLAGAAAGARIHRLLRLMAEQVTRSALGASTMSLTEEDAFRVGILARISWMMLAFTLALGFWAFNALG